MQIGTVHRIGDVVVDVLEVPLPDIRVERAAPVRRGKLLGQFQGRRFGMRVVSEPGPDHLVMLEGGIARDHLPADHGALRKGGHPQDDAVAIHLHAMIAAPQIAFGHAADRKSDAAMGAAVLHRPHSPLAVAPEDEAFAQPRHADRFVGHLVGAGDPVPAIAEAELQQVVDPVSGGRRSRIGPVPGFAGVPRGPAALNPDRCRASSLDRRVAQPRELAAQHRVGPLAASVRIDAGLLQTGDDLRKLPRPTFENFEERAAKARFVSVSGHFFSNPVLSPTGRFTSRRRRSSAARR